MNKQEIRQHAQEHLLKLWEEKEKSGFPINTDSFFPLEVEKVVRLFNWQIEEADIAAYSQDLTEKILGYADSTTSTIYLSKKHFTSSGQRRFTIAHEFGHAVLHEGSPHPHFRRMPPPSRTHKKSIKPNVEAEANYFAAELLMPERTVRAKFKQWFGVDKHWAGSEFAKKLANVGIWDNPELKKFAQALAEYKPSSGGTTLSEYFGVTKEALGFRLMSFNLVYL